MESVIPECSYRESSHIQDGFPITTFGNDVLFEIICLNNNTLKVTTFLGLVLRNADVRKHFFKTKP